jgi:hypothetical protein
MSTGEGISGKVAVEGEDSMTEESEETTDVSSLTTTGKWLASSAIARKGVAVKVQTGRGWDLTMAGRSGGWTVRANSQGGCTKDGS